MWEVERITVGAVDSAIKIEASTDPNPTTGAHAKYDFWLRAFGQWQKSAGSSIKFHEAPPPKPGSTPSPDQLTQDQEPGPNGITHEVLLEVILDRLRSFQRNEKCACRENALAITKLEEALMWLQQRTRDRIRRGVEGKQNAP